MKRILFNSILAIGLIMTNLFIPSSQAKVVVHWGEQVKLY